MKNLACSILLVAVLAACQATPKRKTFVTLTQVVDVVQSGLIAYDNYVAMTGDGMAVRMELKAAYIRYQIVMLSAVSVADRDWEVVPATGKVLNAAEAVLQIVREFVEVPAWKN